MKEPFRQSAPSFRRETRVFVQKCLYRWLKRELILLTAPVLDPPEVGTGAAIVRHGDLRDQYWIVAERCENDLVDGIWFLACRLAVIAHTEYPIEISAVTMVVRAHYSPTVGQIAKSAAVLVLFRIEIVKKLRCPFVLPYLNVPVVGAGRHQPVVSHLMRVIGRGTEHRVGGCSCCGIVDLVAGVAVGRQTEFVLDPFAEVPRSVWLPTIR